DRRNLTSAAGGDGRLAGAVGDRAGRSLRLAAADGDAARADVGRGQRVRADRRGLRIGVAIDHDARLGHHVLGFGLPVPVHVLRVAWAAVALLLVAHAPAAARL